MIEEHDDDVSKKEEKLNCYKRSMRSCPKSFSFQRKMGSHVQSHSSYPPGFPYFENNGHQPVSLEQFICGMAKSLFSDCFTSMLCSFQPNHPIFVAKTPDSSLINPGSSRSIFIMFLPFVLLCNGLCSTFVLPQENLF